MNQKSTAFRNIFITVFFIFFIFAMLGGLFWANLLFVQRSSAPLNFLPWWKGANNLLVEGLSPYGEFTTYEIQKMVYGRAAGPAELPLRVDIPLPLLLLFLPLGGFSDMELARAAWMVVLEISLILLVVFSARLAEWRLRWFELLLIFLFGILFSFSLEALLSASSAILLAMLLFGSIAAANASLDELSGMLLAFSFFEIEIGGLLLLFLLIWAVLNARWRILAGLLMTLTLLVAISFIIDPEWILSFTLAAIINWRASADPSTLSLFTNWFPGLGEQIAWGLTFILLLLLMVESQQALRRGPLQWFWVACLSAAITPLTGLPVKSAGLVMLLPAFLLSVSVLAQRWAVIGRWFGLLVLLVVFTVSWLFANFEVESGFIWISLIAIALLYWVRWWVVRPSRLWADRISTERGGYVSR